MRVRFWVAIELAFVLIILSCEASSSAIPDGPQISKIPVETILNLLRNDQPVIYDHAEIIGDLVIDQPRAEMRSQESVNSTINITDSVFHGNINFNHIRFKKPVVLEGNIVDGDVSFRSASFMELLKFNSTKFLRQADFYQSKFYLDAAFKNTTFQGESNFYGSLFMNDANFDEAKFKEVSFKNSKFNGYSRFGKVLFQESSIFEGSIFSNNVSFNEAQFIGKSFLGWVQFNGKRTYFRQSNFRNYASFTNSSFEDVYFNGANFTDEITFFNSNFKGNMSLTDTRFQKDAIFDKANFSSNVDLDGCDYSRLVLHWHLIRDHIKPGETLYKSLIENYKNLIWLSDASECYYDFRNWKQSVKPWTDVTKIADKFLEWYCGYGTRPLNTLPWIGFLIVVFSIYYWSAGGVSQIYRPRSFEEPILVTAKKVSEDTFYIEFIPKTINEDLPPLRSFLLSLKFSIFALASGNTDDFETNKGIKWQIVEAERWLGRGLFLIFMYYWGSLVISYFTPQP